MGSKDLEKREDEFYFGINKIDNDCVVERARSLRDKTPDSRTGISHEFFFDSETAESHTLGDIRDNYYKNVSIPNQAKKEKGFRGNLTLFSLSEIPVRSALRSITNDSLYINISENPTIVRVLNKIRYIEEIGEGWNRVVNELRKYPLKSHPPSVKGDGRVVVTLFSPDLELESELTQFKDTSLNERRQRALAFLRLYGKIKVSDYMEICSCQRKTALRDLNELLAKKLIKRVGARGKYVHYTMSLNGTSNETPQNEVKNE